MDLQSPSVLAQLPRPLHASTGKTRISDVFSLADAKKRKRYEVAVAVDGEAVNIYNVQTPKLVTSYAVPPQSTFSCTPCSIRRKLPKKSSVKRQTYTAATRPERQIKCFVEEIGSGSTAPVISSSAATITDSSSPTNFVGIVPYTVEDDNETDPFDILAVHEDGRVRRLSSDLKSQRWSIQHSEISKICSTTHAVHSCFLVDLEDAKKALFKRRLDLAALALGDSTASGTDEPSILLIVSHPKDAYQIALKDVTVQMFSVPASAKSGGHEESQRLRHLQTIQVPAPSGLDKVNSDGLQWTFHSGSAGLQLSFSKGFLNVDLSQYSPSVTSQFVLDERFSSVMRISPQCVIGASDSLVAVYDTQYQSVQRSIAAGDVLSGASTNADASMVFISYFAKLGIAVATKGNTLIAFDLTSLHSHSGPSLKRSRDGLLVDAIGRGIGSSAAQWNMASKKHRSENMTSLRLTSPEQVEKWNRLTKDVDEAAKTRNAEKFDKAVLSYFCSSDAPKTLPNRGQYVNPESTLFLLSKMFAVEDSDIQDGVSASSPSQLRLVLWPSATCDWLIGLGHLSPDNVEIALRRASKPRVLQPLVTGSFVQSLIDADSSLKKVNQVLAGPSTISSDELAYALKYFLNQARLHSSALEETARAITSGEIATPTQELTRHLGVQPVTLKDIFTGLNTSIQKVHSQPTSAIVQSLRSNLSRTELISLVHHLRLSLATGGYTSRCTENPPTPITLDQITPSLSLNTIIDLMTASVDAVGPSGWISALPAMDLSDDSDSAIAAASREMELIADMKSEVSAALAGVEEATYLKGILLEYLRFADQVSTPAATAADAVAKIDDETSASSNLVRYEKLNGADLVIFGRPGEGEDGYDGDAGGKMLPLSLKPATADVSKTKINKSTGDTKSRTSREIGYLRRKAVGKYSFERLLV
ncbi:uncharacterized protein N7443_000317 [Penicillium atrosanguineum]|uniref:Utp8 beta-propeller domain-containing protein n=1 Tax=Penicillium atrosanguineum TaxID=1132637 RepID=A0A9W9UBL7_9EURO|nr:uncharacterized protein N7443_000317 [Penicillium atrosanguineum]KAJ5313433.1 hypothetical protein N7443_000317 [Penicillium atrosanguineum]KAJ5330617.1 hypothetical protein N7476_000400 [Penicillium atrosanguineum]